MSEKVCVITGGTSGIGKCTAEAMRRKGYAVYELSRRETGVAGFVHIPTDVTKPEMVDAAIAEVLRQEDHIDVLINNAGFGVSGAVEFTEPAAAKKQLEVNFFGMVNVCHAVLPVMRGAGHGRIVNLSSVAGVAGNAGQANYSASKAGVIGLTKSVARELAPKGITCNAVAPGFVATDMTAALPLTDEQIRAAVPLGRMAKPEEIADAVAFLLQSDYITGQVLCVDGGVAI